MPIDEDVDEHDNLEEEIQVQEEMEEHPGSKMTLNFVNKNMKVIRPYFGLKDTFKKVQQMSN